MLIRLLLLLAATIAEAVPLALAAGVVNAWIVPNGTEVPSPVSVGLAVILGFVSTRVLMRRHVGERRARLALALCAVAVTVPLYLGVRLSNPVGVLRDPVLAPALAALLYAWSRGAALARESLAFDAIYASFRRGLIVLFVGLLIAVATPGTAAHRLAGDGWGTVLVFFLAALCALSLARVEEERHRGAGPEGPPAIRGEWVAAVLAATGGVLLVGLALATLVSPSAVALALAQLGRVRDLLLWLLTPLLLALGTLVDVLLRLLRPLVHGHPATLQRAVGHGKHAPPPAMHLTPAQAQALAHTVLAVAGLALACLALWYAFSYRMRARSDADGEEERESLWSWGLLVAGLRAALRRLWARLLGRRGVDGADAAASATHGEDSGVSSIRQIYRRLLTRAAALGLPRRRSETPHEYLARLREAVPAGEKDAALLTGLYARARYGPGAPHAREVKAATEVWARLEPVLRPRDGDAPGS